MNRLFLFLQFLGTNLSDTQFVKSPDKILKQNKDSINAGDSSQSNIWI